MHRLLLLCLAGCLAAAEYRFLIDDRPIDPEVVALADGSVHPAPGDLVWLGRVPVVLGEPGEYRLQRTGQGATLSEPGAPAALASLQVDQKAEALFALEPAQRRRLRHIALRAEADLAPELLAALADCDPERTVLAITWSTFTTVDAVPALPAGWRHLMLEATSFGPRTSHRLDGLRPLTALRWLRMRSLSRPIDAGVLAGCRDLRRLEAEVLGFVSAGALADLRALVALHLRGCELEPEDGAFLAGLTALRELDLSYSDLARIDAAAALPALADLRLDGARLTTLPAGPWPALRSAQVLGTKVPAAELAAFAAAHPAARIATTWASSLRTTVAGADRLVLRTGGTCHRRPDQEKVLHEERDPAAIAALLGALEVDEARSGDECMCCGDGALEVYVGERHVAMLGFQHGFALRWAGGAWPGDAVLTLAAADRLNAWLDQHGHPGPAREFAAMRAREEAAQRRREAWRAVTTDALVERLLASDAKVGAILAEAFPDGDERALAVLRLFGAGNPMWSGSSAFEEAIERELPTGEELVRLRARILADPVAIAGLARAAFAVGNAAILPRAVHADLLPAAAARALADPCRDNRLDTVRALAVLAEPWVLPLLRGHLAAPEAGDESSSDGSSRIVARPHAWKLPRGIGSRAAAALALARLKDADAAPVIAAAASGATGADAEAFAEAGRQLAAGAAP